MGACAPGWARDSRLRGNDGKRVGSPAYAGMTVVGRYRARLGRFPLSRE